ncbi:MAG: hypothetical protein HRT43_10960 [Campylobacteraceae bacterium]|nr:hypothetical protein [Campylobacteraceae bacterium]
MIRGTRQSQLINNFFSLATIILVSAVLALYVKYFVKDVPRINSGLICQNEIASTTDKLANEKILKLGFRLLNEGSYILDGGLSPSFEFDSVFTQNLNIKQINNIFLKTINIKSTKEKSRFLKIKYELIENEDENLNKIGSLLTSFRINNNEVFSMYIDFLTYDMAEIEKRVQCTLEAFKYNAKQ